MQPGADGQRIEEDLNDEIELNFEIEMFYDPEFTQPYNQSVDIGWGSIQDSKIYIKAEAEMSNDGDAG